MLPNTLQVRGVVFVSKIAGSVYNKPLHKYFYIDCSKAIAKTLLPFNTENRVHTTPSL